jgi:hypothetical protein
MKRISKIASLIAVGTMATPAVALEVSGGDVNLKYSTFIQKIFDTRLDAFSIDGAIELGFNKNFAAQLDLAYYSFGATDTNGNNAVLHGIYHLNDDASFGAFYGQDDFEGFDTDFYGIEAGYEKGRFEVEGYISAGEESGIDGTVYGVYGAYDITNGFDLTGALEKADFDGGVSLARYEIGVRYNAAPSTAFTATIGSANGDVLGASGSESFVTVGAEFTIGAERGATFGRRGLLRLIPGL